MKILFKVIGAIFSLGLVILVLLHIFLQYGLTRAMRDVVLPRVKQEAGIDVRVDRLSINVVHGRLYLKGIAVRNPDGFVLENLASVEEIEVEVDILSLLKQKLIRIKNVTVHDALLNIVRNRDGEINLSKLQERLPPALPPGEVPTATGQPPARPAGQVVVPPAEPPKPLPEILIDALACQARIRYIDFRLDQLDLALDLKLTGEGLGTQRDPSAPWGDLSINGSLGDDRTSFITDLRLGLAPVTDLNALSFDLTGRIMEIDPRIMQEIHERMGIRSAPFGFDPELHCRDNRFNNSSFALNLRKIQLEDKLANRLGGMGSIESLRFPVPVEGVLQEPRINVQAALVKALGGNTQSLLNAFLQGAAAKEAGMTEPPEDIADAAVEILGQHVEEIGESETIKKVLKELADGKPSDTNAPTQMTSDVLIDILGEQVDEVGDNEALKKDLKSLGRALFGK